MIHRSRTASQSASSRLWDRLIAVFDRLVALIGWALLLLGAFLVATGRPDSLSWLLVGTVLLQVDDGVMTRLRVARLEQWARDRQRESRPRRSQPRRAATEVDPGG